MKEPSPPQNQRTSPEGGVSPCVGVCRLDEMQVCVGCARHIVEIAAAGVATERARIEASGKLKTPET